MVLTNGDEHVVEEEGEGVSATELLIGVDDLGEGGATARKGRITSMSEDVLKMEPQSSSWWWRAA